MSAIVVPSDITIMEEKTSIGKRRLGLFESIGLLGKWPMLHLHYSKIDRADMKAVLSKKYDADDNSAAADICKRRQASVSKSICGQSAMWGTAWGMTGLTWWSFRRYNYQSRLIALPFVFYGGTFVGRVVADVITGRNAEYARDRFLGELPGKVYYNPSD